MHYPTCLPKAGSEMSSCDAFQSILRWCKLDTKVDLYLNVRADAICARHPTISWYYFEYVGGLRLFAPMFLYASYIYLHNSNSIKFVSATQWAISWVATLPFPDVIRKIVIFVQLRLLWSVLHCLGTSCIMWLSHIRAFKSCIFRCSIFFLKFLV